jgi:hypothetical protein
MADSKEAAEMQSEVQVTTGPMVFISHDSRDAELAEAFAKLLKSVSAGMIKTFRSSDKKPGDGIDFGEEWYKRLMTQLQVTSDVVCLFTERSLGRPWILFEAGVAKGKLDTPVIGVALGVPLNSVTAGPFYQFQNMDDSEQDLSKLVHQLAKRVSGLELDPDVVSTQVKAFKAAEAQIIKAIGGASAAKPVPAPSSDSNLAKLIEEMKSLPSRVAERLVDDGFSGKRNNFRRIHPMMLAEVMFESGEDGDPTGVLLAASIVRDEMPWLYELSMEVYRAAISGEPTKMRDELKRLRRASELFLRGPFIETLGRKENYMIAVEFPKMLERVLQSRLARESGPKFKRAAPPPP